MRNGKVRTRKAAEAGTGTYDLVTFMNDELENVRVSPTDPDDLDAAAIVTKKRIENIGLASGLLWDEHAHGWIIGVFARYAIYGTSTPKPVADPRHPKPTKVPEPFKDAFGNTGNGPDIDDGTREDPELGADEDAPKVTGAAAQKYFTHVKKGQAQVLFYMTHGEIAANVSVRRNTISGKTHIADEWDRLLEGVPEGMRVFQCFTPEQLESFDLRGDFPAEDA